jgi:hypothetical protein
VSHGVAGRFDAVFAPQFAENALGMVFYGLQADGQLDQVGGYGGLPVVECLDEGNQIVGADIFGNISIRPGGHGVIVMSKSVLRSTRRWFS